MSESVAVLSTSKSGGMHYAWWILVVCCLLMGINIGMINSTAALFIAAVPKDMHVATGSFSLWISLKQLFMVLTFPIAAKVYSKHSMKGPLVAGVIINSIGTASLYFATGLMHFYIVGVVAGSAAAFIHLVPCAILCARWFHKSLGFANGMCLAFCAIGGLFFNPLMGYFIATYGWQTAYLATGIINVVVVVPVVLLVVKDHPADKGLQPYGYGAPAAEGPAVVHTLTPAGDGVSKAAAYRNPAFYCLIAFAFLFSCYGALAMFLPPYVFSLLGGHENAKVAMTAAAQLAAILSIVAGIAMIVLGWANDRLGATFVTVFSGACMVVGAVLVLAVGPNELLISLVSIIIAIGLGSIALQPPVITARTFGKKNYAEIYGWIGMMISFGSAVCITVVGYVYDYTKSYVIPFYGLAALVVLGVIFYLIAISAGKRLVWEKA